MSGSQSDPLCGRSCGGSLVFEILLCSALAQGDSSLKGELSRVHFWVPRLLDVFHVELAHGDRSELLDLELVHVHLYLFSQLIAVYVR